MPTSVARRVGVLTALDDTDGRPSPSGMLPRVTSACAPTACSPRSGTPPPASYPGGRCAPVVADVPATWWPHPAVGDTLVPLIEGIFGGSSGEISETPTFPVRVTTDDGTVVEWRATPHYLSGYRRRDAALARRLVDHLVAAPEARVLLARPDDLLARLGEILRAH